MTYSIPLGRTEVPMTADQRPVMLALATNAVIVEREEKGAAMPTQQITNGRPSAADPDATPAEEQQLRELAVKRLERKRRFGMRAVSYAVVGVVLIAIWAITEYHNAGGWPTSGFSQSSSIPHEWNIWIIYPVLGLGLAVGIDAWHTFGHKPITEREIRREMDRLTRPR